MEVCAVAIGVVEYDVFGWYLVDWKALKIRIEV